MRFSHLLYTVAAGSLTVSCAVSSGVDGDDTGEGTDAVRRCASGSTTRGVDVSEFQGSVDWHAAHAAGIRFGIARVSDGTGHHDTQFAHNWSHMKSAGVVRGAYQFFRPGEDPKAQARLLLQKVKDAGGFADDDLPPTLDVEVTDGVSHATIGSRVRAWVDYVADAIGRKPMVYTAPGFWDGIGAPSGLSTAPLWVANWEVSCPDVPSHWSKWTFWQTADNGHVSGISGAVDLDRFNGSASALGDFARKWNADVSADRVMVSTYGSGRLDLFGRNGDRHLVHRYYADHAWHDWKDLGGKLASSPAVVSWASGRIDVFAQDDDAHLVHKWWSDGKWSSGWEDLGGKLTSAPTVASQGERSLDVFARDTDDHLVHKYFRPEGGWSGWEDLGGDLASTPTAVSWAPGRLDVFARAGDSRLMHIYFRSGGPGWSDWERLHADIKSGPTVTSWAEGRLDVFAIGAHDNLVHRWFDADGWSDWQDLGGKLVSAPGAVSWGEGRIDVFARGGDDLLVHKYYDAGWSDWKHEGHMP